MRNVVLGAAVLALCHVETPAAELELPVAPVEVQVCTRVDGAQLGALPLELPLGGKTVRLAEWTMADERASAFIGFAAQLPADVTYTVEAGTRTFRSDSPRWLHPDGVWGPGVHGIDAVTFCTRPAAAVVAQR